MPQALYDDWVESLRSEGLMTADELAQYHEEYQQWLDRTSRSFDDELVFLDQME